MDRARTTAGLLITGTAWVGLVMSMPLAAAEPAWERASLSAPMTAAETRAFIGRLVDYVFDHHLKRDNSPQRGLVYEYLRVDRQGQPDQFVEGEALDTMHDGAWLAAALVTAYRATAEDRYRDLLTRWQLPFYLKMLNHSDTLFAAPASNARSTAPPFGREHALQPGERGFVPYWWDDGGSVSLERTRTHSPLLAFPAVDLLAGKPNPLFKLDGYSLGSSNHMAQDLAVMLELCWLLAKDGREKPCGKLAGEIASAARNLQDCRMRHFGHIPMCDAAAALSNHDPALLKSVRSGEAPTHWTRSNAYVSALSLNRRGQRVTTPGFADDQQYNYYYTIARDGGRLTEPMAFRTIYDAFTLPQLYAFYSDDAEVPAGINRFDLHPIHFQDGKPLDYRSDRKGPFKGPRPIGSRMGPQNMIVCGWALQALRMYPGIWEKPYRERFSEDMRVFIEDDQPSKAPSQAKRQPIELGDAPLLLSSSRRALRVEGSMPRRPEGISWTIYAEPDANGPHAIVRFTQDRISAANDAGQPLLIDGRTKPEADGVAFAFELPYTATKGQGAWANGIEHGRYSIAARGVRRNFYLASSEQRVRRWLEHELAGGLRTWEAIFNEYGYIPTGIRAGSVLPGVDWDRFSDSGGYAHLVSAAAQWLFYLGGKQDWESHHVPTLLP